jgi:hypothetical protein
MLASMARTTREWHLNYSNGEGVLCVRVGSFGLFARGETTIVDVDWRNGSGTAKKRLRNGSETAMVTAHDVPAQT